MANAAYGMMRAHRLLESPGVNSLIIAGLGEGLEVRTARQLWPDVFIIGVEPLREFNRQRPQSLNPDVLIQAALGSLDGDTVEMYLNYVPDQRASVFPTRVELKNSRRREVPVRTLASVIADHEDSLRSPCMLWLDAEGSELDILAGASTSLARVDYVNCEVCWLPVRTGCLSWQVDDHLRASGLWPVGMHSVATDGHHGDIVYARRDEWVSLADTLTARSIRRKRRMLLRKRWQRRRRRRVVA